MGELWAKLLSPYSCNRAVPGIEEDQQEVDTAGKGLESSTESVCDYL
jgi:hypothetical protein